MKRYIILLAAALLFGTPGNGQSLEAYFKIAAENNPGLQAVYKEYEVALQRVPQVNSIPDPVLSFGYFLSPAETRVGPQQARFSLTQMFPWFGTLKARGNVAALLAEAKFENFMDARNKLFLQVASAYYPLYEIRTWMQLEEENIRILESYQNIATRKFENGTASMVDVLRAEIMLNEAQTNLEILKDQQGPMETAFNNLLNRPVGEGVFTSDTLIAEVLSGDLRKDSLISRHPIIQALELKLQSSKTSELLARRQGFPQLGIGLDYVLVGEREDLSLPDNGKDIFMPMISISIPIFRGKYNASVKEAQLMQESYAFQRQEAENKLISEYEAAWFDVQKQLQLLTLYKEQIQTTEQSLNLLFTSYGNSGKEFEELLRMQQKLLQYQKMRTTALVQYHLAVAKIHYLTSKNEIR